ncbi:unnamed protein product [Somion occarium]|uniref:Ribosomal protein S21 n=1 Tax=Somion occarium TaxID=3059160 RepID=A0ABP1DAC1_9APHY
MVQTRTNSTASSGLPGTSRSAVDSISQPLTPNTSEPHSTWNFLRTQPISKTSKTQSSQEMWKATETSHIHSRPPGPYAGRSVAVSGGKPFGSAYVELQQILRRNLVSYELRLAERHEKKGYKRRRLASDRHRRRFAHEVRKKVQLVNEIRARGA